MKKYLLIILLLSCKSLYSQNLETLNDIQKKIYSNEDVQVKAEFSKGENYFKEYVLENLKKQPNKYINSEISVCFIVDFEGTLLDVEIIKNTSNYSFDEIQKVILNSPKWLSAEHDGYRVKVKVKFNFII